MFIQLALGSERFLHLIRNRVTATIPCFSGDLGEYVLDHLIPAVDSSLANVESDVAINVPDGTPTGLSVSTLSGTHLQVSQPLDLYLTRIADLTSANMDPVTEWAKNPQVRLVLDVRMAVSFGAGPGTPQLIASFSHVEAVFLDPASLDAVNAAVSSAFAPVAMDIATGGFTALPGELPSVVNAGIIADSTGDYIAMRLELRDSPMNAADTLALWKIKYSAARRTPGDRGPPCLHEARFDEPHDVIIPDSRAPPRGAISGKAGNGSPGDAYSSLSSVIGKSLTRLPVA